MRYSKLSTVGVTVILVGSLVWGILAFSLYLNNVNNTSDDVVMSGLLVLLIVCIYWIIGGVLSRQSYLRYTGWRKGFWLAVTSFLVLAALFIGRDTAPGGSHTQALLELGFRLMLSGLFICNVLLLQYVKEHIK
jgi:hypothetical protein